MVLHRLAVDPAVTPDQLAATAPGPPYVFNGVPLAIAQMASPQSAADEIGGVSYTAYYGNMAAQAGRSSGSIFSASAAAARATVESCARTSCQSACGAPRLAS